MKCLTKQQIEEAESEIIFKGHVVRFLKDGCAFNIVTGEICKKGINIIRQIHYWCFSKETSKKIAKWLNCKAVFSKEKNRQKR